MHSTEQQFRQLLHLADNSLILSQRNSEWCGHGPVLEQDIAITNISLDLLGQAKYLYNHVATIYNQLPDAEKAALDLMMPRLWKTFNRDLSEDDLAFLRDENQYYNFLMLELPRGDWGFTILRQFFFSTWQQLVFQDLQIHAGDEALKAIMEKSLKEIAYHVRWSSEWVIRLGDGTADSHDRVNHALENLWNYTGELFEQGLITGIDYRALQTKWENRVTKIFEEATLQVPGNSWMQTGGTSGKHTEHMGYLLTELQYMQRTFPNANW